MILPVGRVPSLLDEGKSKGAIQYHPFRTVSTIAKMFSSGVPA